MEEDTAAENWAYGLNTAVPAKALPTETWQNKNSKSAGVFLKMDT